MSNVKHPIPDKVVVSGQALAQIINALNGPQYMILELLHTRSIDALLPTEQRNPINVIEGELLAYQRGESVPVGESFTVSVDTEVVQNYVGECLRKLECPYAIDSDFENCALRNYQRLEIKA